VLGITSARIDEYTKVGDVQQINGRNSTRVTVTMYHEKLHEHKSLSSPDIYTLKEKIKTQAYKWSEKWQAVEKKQQAALIKQRSMTEKENAIEEARRRTIEAAESFEQLDNILMDSITINNVLDWESLKRKDKFPEIPPQKSQKQRRLDYPQKPDRESAEFTPSLNFFQKLIGSMREKKIQEFEEKYKQAISLWYKQTTEIDSVNQKNEKDYNDMLKKWENAILEHEKNKNIFYQERDAFNEKIEQIKKDYFSGTLEAIIYCCEIILDRSNYPENFPKDYELEYNPETKILIIEYELPSIDVFPKIKEVKFNATSKAYKETYITNNQLNARYDDTIYKIALRTIHELFESDVIDAYEAVSFNGWVKAVNKATGVEENNCILSLHVTKKEFQKIELANIDPKACFKNLKGVASSKLSSLTPVKPILQIEKTDRRFVESYEVANMLENSTNLAAMDWEDFEHLIRELFEKEFESGGGEVKITQASRDGGVDAVAFDPDPIRGGKIVIQAKRYTNTVGVSAVRDLYGTILNEGATKGILVSTADYGPDAYEFAKGKPITLLNGSNLLHLLEKHGHHAKIDIREAKKILSEKNETSSF
jgi:restriction system protein